MDYEFLTPEARIATLTTRIQGLERDHYGMSLDADLDTGDATRFAKVTEQLEKLKADRASLQGEIDARDAKTANARK